MWIDTHCHLDAFEFGPDQDAVRHRAQSAGVRHCVIPAVHAANFSAVRQLAHRFGDSYALGLHPLYVADATAADLSELDAALRAHRGDPRLVALGEIGLDFFVPALCTPAMRSHQEQIYRAQLRLAIAHGLPLILHVRRSADRLLKHLRELAPAAGWRGIAHAFNGSEAQALAFVQRGFALGFGGACTFSTALQLRRLATSLPPQAVVLETDSPDIPPQWLYVPAEQRHAGVPQGINTPAQLPAIAQVVADLRGISPVELALINRVNACRALPKLAALLPSE